MPNSLVANKRLLAFLTLAVLAVGLFWSVTVAVADATKTKTLISGQGAEGARDGANHFSLDDGVTFAPAFIVRDSIPTTWGTIAGTKWINFSRDATSVGAPQTTIYRTHFSLPATFDSPELTVTVYADNSVTVFLNGDSVGNHTGFSGTVGSLIVDDGDVNFQKGRNVLTFEVLDTGGAAGLRYSATIKYTAKGKGKP